MGDRLDDFTEALAWIEAAYELLCSDECPPDVAAHVDFAARRLAAHVSVLGGLPTRPDYRSGHWLN